MKKTVYLSAFVFAAAISLIGCGDPLLDDLNSNIEVGSGDLSIAENYEQAAGMFLTAQQKMHDVGASNGAHVYQVQFNIHIDNYSGYMAGTQNFSGNLPSTYRYFLPYCRPRFRLYCRRALAIRRCPATHFSPVPQAFYRSCLSQPVFFYSRFLIPWSLR